MQDTGLSRRSWIKALAACMTGSPAVLAAADSKQVPGVHDRIRKLAANAPLEMQFRGGSAADCRKWQSEFSAKLRSLLGPHQPPSQWKTTSESVTDFDDHRRESLVLEAAGHPALPLYLLTPRGAAYSGPRPGIVALHGHGPFGHDPVAGVDATPELKENIARFNYDFGLRLVRRGYVVVAPCFTPFGRRLDSNEDYQGQDACAVSFVRMLLLGKTLMAENLRDALWAFELLARRENVDAERLGCVGLSYGGRMAMLTSALEPRIRVAVPSGALNLMQERIGRRYSCGAQVIPGLLEYGDVPEIASLIAPRPCLWEIGTRDPLMVKDWIPPALARIRRAYQALAAADQLQVDFFDGAHRWNGAKAFPLLRKILKP